MRQESTTTTTTTSSVVDDEVEQEREAWVRSPVRTRLRERRLELRRESLKARIDARRNNSDRESAVQKMKSGSQMVKAFSFLLIYFLILHLLDHSKIEK